MMNKDVLLELNLILKMTDGLIYSNMISLPH